MTHQAYIRAQLIQQNRLMVKYRPQVKKALKSQIQDSIDLMRSHGIEFALAHVKRHFTINDEIGQVINSLYSDAARGALKRFTVNKADPIFGSMGIDLSFVKAVLDYFSAYLLEKVVIPISQTTTDFIAKVLGQAITQGWGVEQTVKELENTDVSEWRARMIVRTESVRAMNYSQLKAADNENYQVEKQWIAIEDKRTRFGAKPGGHNHLGVDGQRRDLYDAYANGLLYPGDPNGVANQTINCRCTQGFYLKRDLEGNLIPKQTNILQTI